MLDPNNAVFDTVRDGTASYKRYKRVSQFWTNRSSKNGVIGASFEHAQEATKLLLNANKNGGGASGITCNSSIINKPNWSFLGPDESAIQDYGEPITDVAEMQLIFDQEGWNIIKDKVKLRTDVKVHKEKVMIPIDQTFWVNNVTFPANTRVPMYVGFSFLTDEASSKTEFKYDIQQYLSATATTPRHLLGGEHFIIKKPNRNDFDADAGDDKEIKHNETVTVSATDILENATYNWYDADGNLIYTGKDLAVSPQITEKYKLEVIAAADGFKDYDEVIVEVKDCYIEALSPNPASNNVMVEYKTENISSAYIMVLNSTATTNNNYLIDINQTQANFNVANFQQGSYSVILVCDGMAVDMRTLIVQ